MKTYIHHLLIYVCMLCIGTDLPFLYNLFPISLFVKCPVLSCVQIMEC